MTNLVGPIPDSKGDVLTTTNNGQGLNSLLKNVQDGDGNNSAILLSTQQFQVNGGYLAKRTTVATPTYSALPTDYLIAVTANAAGVLITLPEPSAATVGQMFIVQDEVGNANTHNILVEADNALINGAAGVTLSVDYNGFFFYTNGQNYFCITSVF